VSPRSVSTTFDAGNNGSCAQRGDGSAPAPPRSPATRPESTHPAPATPSALKPPDPAPASDGATRRCRRSPHPQRRASPPHRPAPGHGHAPARTSDAATPPTTPPSDRCDPPTSAPPPTRHGPRHPARQQRPTTQRTTSYASPAKCLLVGPFELSTSPSIPYKTGTFALSPAVSTRCHELSRLRRVSAPGYDQTLSSKQIRAAPASPSIDSLQLIPR